MKYAQIVSVLKLLTKAQAFHRNAADEYAQLFNASFGGKVPEVIPAYTPLQEFYQRLAQRHLCIFFGFQQDELYYRELIDLASLDAGDGLEPEEKALPEETPAADESAVNGL